MHCKEREVSLFFLNERYKKSVSNTKTDCLHFFYWVIMMC